ncbi:MAG: DNA gyrase inhibitor YacG [Planctomycetia bacterium]|nr:DNA gyrase inhibitor YacG [Planctomycetia bacterium]
MTFIHCPCCGKLFELEISEAPPFCSARCKMADLNCWLSESYSLPVDINAFIEEKIAGTQNPQEDDSE